MHHTSSCTWVKGILAMFAGRGVDVPHLVGAVGIDPRRLESPQERFGADEVSRLWQLAVVASGDPALGLERALTARYVDFDVVGYAMLSSPDLRSGLERLARYMAVVSDAASFELQREGERHWLVLGGTGYTLPVPRQRYAYGMLSLVTLCQWLTRREVQPLAVEFKFEAPPEACRYRDEFGCPVRFGQPENRMLLASEDLQAPIPSCNASMFELHEQVLRERLAKLQDARTSRRVS
ncbi:MAG TPA: AraC family transcriptional regulator, partial [Ramlibacter sp.]|nr:AraC family transcriptional regulator [Ramlibacter sp.]